MPNKPVSIGFFEPQNDIYKNILERISRSSSFAFCRYPKDSLIPETSDHIIIFHEDGNDLELAKELGTKNKSVILLSEEYSSLNLTEQNNFDLVFFNSKSDDFQKYIRYQIEHITRRNKRTKSLMKANKQLNKYIYSITHDLKAPLTSLLGLTEILKNGDETIPRLDFFNLMERSIARMEDHIETTLDYYKNQLTEVHPKQIKIIPFIDDLVEAHQHFNKVVKIQTEISGCNNFVTDPLRLKVALSNLISNAIRYGNKGKGEYLVLIKARCTKKDLSLSVIDKGPGIDPARQKTLFRLFSGNDENLHTGGIGLFLAKDATEKIGGRIELNSRLGEGSEFAIQLPSLSLEIS